MRCTYPTITDTARPCGDAGWSVSQTHRCSITIIIAAATAAAVLRLLIGSPQEVRTHRAPVCETHGSPERLSGDAHFFDVARHLWTTPVAPGRACGMLG